MYLYKHILKRKNKKIYIKNICCFFISLIYCKYIKTIKNKKA